MKSIDLWYPRVEGNDAKIRVQLMDVRAANDIVISYDFERDGWAIESDLYNPENKESEQSDELHEVAFISAWPIASMIGG